LVLQHKTQIAVDSLKITCQPGMVSTDRGGTVHTSIRGALVVFNLVSTDPGGTVYKNIKDAQGF
jgi:hypothetical protein